MKSRYIFIISFILLLSSCPPPTPVYPDLTITLPASKVVNGVKYYYGDISFNSKAEIAEYSFTINSKEYTAKEADGVWTVENPQVEGKCALYVSVTDSAGMKKIVTKNLYIDNVKPVISFNNSSASVTKAEKGAFKDNFPAGDPGAGGAISDRGSGVDWSSLECKWKENETTKDGKTYDTRVATVKDYLGQQSDPYEYEVEITD